MTGARQFRSSIAGTLVALAVGYGLWSLAGLIVELTSADTLEPLLRLIVMIGGLSFAEKATVYVEHISKPHPADATGEQSS